MSSIRTHTGATTSNARHTPPEGRSLDRIGASLGLEADAAMGALRDRKRSVDIDYEQSGQELASTITNLLGSTDSGKQYSALRLDALVSRCLGMSSAEANDLLFLSGDQTLSSAQSPEAFHSTLLGVIRQHKLHALFVRAEQGDLHRSIVPSAYNERTGEVYGEEMARWRADFREMAPERQMMTATIIWLYRSGPDSIWLRRVPCTWLATEALNYMRDAGCLGAWIRLLATYPGW